MDQLPPDAFLQQQRFTRSTHRDIYPFIDPSRSPLSQSQRNRIVVITGASQGLGHLAFARSFALAGAKALILTARNEAKLVAVQQELQAEFKDLQVVVYAMNVSDEQSQREFWEIVRSRYGFASVLVSNAGVDPGMQMIKEVDPMVWWGRNGMLTDYACLLETNLKGHFLSCRYFLRLLPADYGGAAIVDVSSGFAVLPAVPGFSTNAISKLASVQLCNYIAAEHPEVTVLALHPGIVLTNIVETAFSWAKGMALDTFELVGGTAVWLTTPAAKFLSGRFVCANWDMEELMARKEEIVSQNKLKMKLEGEFGPQQFQ